MFPKYPYLDLSDRNLDFLTKAIREMENEVKNFVSLNAVKYANPIQWNITKQYEKNTIVIVQETGVAYISVKPVPRGVNILRSEYWTPVFDLSRFIEGGLSNFANHYERDFTYTATMNIDAGEWVVWDSKLWRVIVDITIGDMYAPNINIERFTVEMAVVALTDLINTETQNRTNADTALGGRIDTEIQNRMDADTALGGRIDAEIQNRMDADTALGGRIDAEIQNRMDADTALGGRIDAEIQNRIAADAGLGGRVDVVETGLARLMTKYNPSNMMDFNGKRVCIVGDSISSTTTYPPNWTVPFTELITNAGGSVTNIAVDGASIAGFANDLSAIPTGYDYYIIFLGINDAMAQFPIYGETIAGYVGDIMNRINDVGVTVWYVSPIKALGYDSIQDNANNVAPVNAYRCLLETLFNAFGAKVLSGLGAPSLNNSTKNVYMTDGLHPKPEYRYILCDYILQNIINDTMSFSNVPVSQTQKAPFTGTGTGTITFNWYNNMVQIVCNINNTMQAGSWNYLVVTGKQGVHGIIPDSPYFPAYVRSVEGHLYYIKNENGNIMILNTDNAGATEPSINFTLEVPLFHVNVKG